MARLASASPTRPTERRYSAVGVSSPSPPRAFNVRRPIAARGQARAGATGDEGGYHWAGIRPDRTQAGPAGRAPSNRTRVEEYNMCGYRVAPPRCRPRQEAPGVTHDPRRGCFQPLALVQSVLAPLAKSQQLLQPANEIDRCTDRKELTSSKVDKVSRLHVPGKSTSKLQALRGAPVLFGAATHRDLIGVLGVRQRQKVRLDLCSREVPDPVESWRSGGSHIL